MRAGQVGIAAAVAAVTLLAAAAASARFSPEPPLSANIVCSDAEVVDQDSNRHLNKLLAPLVSNSTFFSVFKVALDNHCPFWDDDGQCMIRECSVCNCDDNEVPTVWRDDDARQSSARLQEENTPPCTRTTLRGDVLNDVDRSLPGFPPLLGPPTWNTHDSGVWTVQDNDESMMYVDLRNNPEQYTGYSGPGAGRVWASVYDENCFSFSASCRTGICAPDTCKEERVLYRLISGIHSSISMHIAKRYLHGNRWGVNIDLYKDRVRSYPERITNLYVTFAVVLRAVSKASATLNPAAYSYVTGDDSNDALTQTMLERLFEHPLLEPGCEDRMFDESDMFLQKNEDLLPQFRGAFRNISMIMDCVGCEKCRLWGKLQFLGLGTALRILFEDEMPELQRNEVIALFNLLYKLSCSVMWVESMEQVVRVQASGRSMLGTVLGALMVMLVSVRLHRNGLARKEARSGSKKTPTNASPTVARDVNSPGTDSQAGHKTNAKTSSKLRNRAPQRPSS